MSRILVADDAQENRVLLERILIRAGHEVTLARDGAQALELEALGTFDLVLLDLGMPRLDGFATAEAIRARDRARGLRRPIIAVSAFDPTTIAAELERADFDVFLPKPVDDAALLGAIARFAGDEGSPHDPDVEELMPVFLESRRADLLKLESLLAAEEWDAVARIGHTIRGSAGMFGVKALAVLGGELEAAAHRGEATQARAIAREIAVQVTRLGKR